MIGQLKDLTRSRDGRWVISFSTPEDFRETFDRLAGKDVSVEIKRASKKRSRTANDFCWAMCRDLANAMNLTKEDVYRMAIRAVGDYEPLPIKAEAVETFQNRWQAKGVGWFAEVIDDSKLPGYKLVFAYYGSSTYDTASMSRLIDYLVQDARSIGLPIPTSKEREEMLKSWGMKVREKDE